MSKITFTVIGFGHIGRCHSIIIDGHPGCELIAIAGTNPEVLNGQPSIH